jgi:hypothetical protein
VPSGSLECGSATAGSDLPRSASGQLLRVGLRRARFGGLLAWRRVDKPSPTLRPGPRGERPMWISKPHRSTPLSGSPLAEAAFALARARELGVHRWPARGAPAASLGARGPRYRGRTCGCSDPVMVIGGSSGGVTAHRKATRSYPTVATHLMRTALAVVSRGGGCPDYEELATTSRDRACAVSCAPGRVRPTIMSSWPT